MTGSTAKRQMETWCGCPTWRAKPLFPADGDVECRHCGKPVADRVNSLEEREAAFAGRPGRTKAMDERSARQSARLQAGQWVNVLNRKLISGTFFVEGRAEVLEILEASDHRALVKFENDELHGPVERFVDPLAQGTEEEVALYLAFLNEADRTKWPRRGSDESETPPA